MTDQAAVRQIRAIVVRVGQTPKVELIEDNAEAIQAIVGGYFELIRLSDGVCVWCNEEGGIRGLPPNGVIVDAGRLLSVCGDFCVTRETDEELADVTAEDIDEWCRERRLAIVGRL